MSVLWHERQLYRYIEQLTYDRHASAHVNAADSWCLKCSDTLYACDTGLADLMHGYNYSYKCTEVKLGESRVHTVHFASAARGPEGRLPAARYKR